MNTDEERNAHDAHVGSWVGWDGERKVQATGRDWDLRDLIRRATLTFTRLIVIPNRDHSTGQVRYFVTFVKYFTASVRISLWSDVRHRER
jgi:hypothetical protein